MYAKQAYQILHGIKPPPKRRGPKLKYPFKDMQVGDCIQEDDVTRRTRIGDASRKYGANHGKRFITRIVYDEKKEMDVIRVWRIE